VSASQQSWVESKTRPKHVIIGGANSLMVTSAINAESTGTRALWRALSSFTLGITFIFCASVAPVFAQGDGGRSQQSQPSDVLRGTVLNGITHEPIGHALVLSSDNRFATMTDDRGHFEFALPPAAPEQTSQTSGTSGSSAGQTVAIATARIRQSTNNRPNFLVARKTGFLPIDSGMQGISVAPDQQDVTITLLPEGHIVGHVILPGLESADGIHVDLYKRLVREGRPHWDSVGTVTARSDGEFRFADLSAGSYKIFTQELLDRDPLRSDSRAQLFGYPPVYYPAAADFAAAVVIRLSAGQTFQATLSPARREYYRVKLGILNGVVGSRPEIQIWRQGHEGPGYSLGYDFRDGTVVGTLPNGAYTVQVLSNGANSMTGATNIMVSGAPVTGAMIALLPNSSISVSVMEQFQHRSDSSLNAASGNVTPGAGRTNVSVMLLPDEELGARQIFALRQPTGPGDESLIIENVLPGSYHVQVGTAVGYAASITSGGTDLQRFPLQVGLGAAPPQIEVILRDDGGVVDGSTIADAGESAARDGKLNSAAQMTGLVYFLPMDDAGTMQQVWIPPDGNFHTQQLAPGNYRVLAFERQRSELEFTNEELAERYASKSQVVSVVAGQTEHLRLQLIAENE
jgi:hypothetical protein